MLVVATARAQPPEHANAAFVRFWNAARLVVSLEGRKHQPAPFEEQRIRMRTELLPLLELDLKNDLEHWLADVDTAVGLFRPGHFRRFSEAVRYVRTRRNDGRTSPGFDSRWLTGPAAKKLAVWLPLRWDPLLSESERDVTEAEELMVMMGFRLEPLSAQEFGWPPRARLWWRVVKEPALEAAEAELARQVGSRRVEAIYRKTVLVATLRARADRWVIERLQWLDRQPGRGRARGRD